MIEDKTLEVSTGIYHVLDRIKETTQNQKELGTNFEKLALEYNKIQLTWKIYLL